MLSGTFGRATVRQLKAVVPPTNTGAPLDALHPSILGRLIWEPQTLSRLLGGHAADIELSLDMVWTAGSVEMLPRGTVDVENGAFLDKVSADHLRAAERFVAQYWTGFCREAAPWLLGSGISKFVIAGKLNASDRLIADF